MILGTIIGKTTTNEFTFAVEQKAKKFDYVQVMHKEYGFVLCQIVDIIKDATQVLAKCSIIGYVAPDKTVQPLRDPFEVGLEVLYAQDDFIQEVVKLEKQDLGAYIGKLEGRDIPIYLDLQKLLTKHVAVLAKSGAGKSYCVGVLLEEIIQRRVPLVIIDPHGEYETLKEKAKSTKEHALFGISPKGFRQQVHMYGDTTHHQSAKPLFLSDNLTGQEIIQMMPSKLSSAQEALLYSVLKKQDTADFDELLASLEIEESPAKWNVIQMIEQIKDYGIFSKNSISYNELVQSNRCSILNLKGIPPNVQEIIVYKVLKDLFELRKQEKVPPFFCVIEEAHNFCPERGFGTAMSSGILRNIASEGRKFGLGLAVVSQRPARVEKSVLSQITTQIILKVTNPNDLKALSQSIEGITSSSESEIQNLTIGHALVTGVVDIPLFVNIRPRMSKHGGDSVNMLSFSEKEDSFMEQLEEFEEQEMLPIIEPTVTKQDVQLMSDQENPIVKTTLIPCVLFSCEGSNVQYPLLVSKIDGSIITDLTNGASAKLPNLEQLTQLQLQVLQKAFALQQFTIEQYLQKYGGGLGIVDVLNALVRLKYLSYTEVTKTYHITQNYVLSDLKKHAVYQKIVHRSIAYDYKKEPQVSLDSIKEQVLRFVHIADQHDCYLVVYEV